MDIEQRQQLALQIVVPAVEQLQRHPQVKKWSGAAASDEDLLGAMAWACFILATKRQGSSLRGMSDALGAVNAVARYINEQSLAGLRGPLGRANS